MKNNLQTALRPVVSAARKFAKSNAFVSNLLHDTHNAGHFTNLRSHELMLADSVRVEGYRAGLAGSVKAGDVVLDLGTGSGILSILAAQQKPKRIYALDHSPFISIARDIAEHNGIECISFIEVNSRSFEPPEPVDVVIHEQMGPALFEENMVENLLDLKARVLRPNGKIAPGKFEVFVEPIVEKPDFNVPFLADLKIDGVDLSFLRDDPRLEQYKNIEYPVSPYESRAAFQRFLAEPTPIMSFDLNDMTRPDELAQVYTAERTILADGPLHGFCIHFRTVFPNGVAFDTSPASRFTHWNNRILRADGRALKAGETLRYTFHASPIADPRFWRVDVT